jgi:hypothetical protein
MHLAKHVDEILDHELTHASHFSNGQFAVWNSAFGAQRAAALSEFYAYHGGISAAQTIGSNSWVNWSRNQMLYYFNIFQ